MRIHEISVPLSIRHLPYREYYALTFVFSRFFSVDTETDALMQQLIHEQFRSSTVIFIAHRLDTIMSCDRIVMLEQGSIIESGPPRELLARGGATSAFAKFVNERTATEVAAKD